MPHARDLKEKDAEAIANFKGLIFQKGNFAAAYTSNSTYLYYFASTKMNFNVNSSMFV